jgi:hypothetical protein
VAVLEEFQAASATAGTVLAAGLVVPKQAALLGEVVARISEQVGLPGLLVAELVGWESEAEPAAAAAETRQEMVALAVPVL